MAWRLARSLERLRDEFDALAPNRSKAADGTIGDAAHASRCSRHNPNADGIVCAIDITHDPSGGCDVHREADRLVIAARDGTTNPDFEYVVSDGRIASRGRGWSWRAYQGESPHRDHAHFAVGRGSDCDPTGPYDDPAPWGVAVTGGIWMPDALLLVHPSEGTPDALAGLLGLYLRPDQPVALTCNADSARDALSRGVRVHAIGGPACRLVEGDHNLAGASRLETAEAVIAQARAGW